MGLHKKLRKEKYMNYIRNNKLLVIASACVLGFVVFWLIIIFNYSVTLTTFWDSSSSLIGGAIGGIATIITVVVLVEVSRKQNEKKELAEYSTNLAELLDGLGIYVRKMSNLKELKEKEAKKYLEKREHGFGYFKMLSNPDASSDELKDKEDKYEECITEYNRVLKEFNKEDNNFFEYDDKIVSYIIKIKIQLKAFITSYPNNNAIQQAEFLYREVEQYERPTDRDKLDMYILDRISENIQDFIDEILESL